MEGNKIRLEECTKTCLCKECNDKKCIRAGKAESENGNVMEMGTAKIADS